MFALILTVCATAAMDDCQVYNTGRFATEHQCLAMASLQRDVLGEATNYRIQCEREESEHDTATESSR